MIDSVAVFLREQLEGYFGSQTRASSPAEHGALVVFPDGEKLDASPFRLGTVTLLLINLAEEVGAHAPDRYLNVSQGGPAFRVQPGIAISMYVLVVANFKNYGQSLLYISMTIQFFLKHRVFCRETAPKLDRRIDRLVVEMTTLSLSEQNNLWSMLRVTYRPSVVYKIKMIVFEDHAPQALPVISEVRINVEQ
jgi:hypothetical protein